MSKTLVDIDDDLLAEVIAKSGAATKKQAINDALAYYLEAQRKGPEAAWRELFAMVDTGLLDLDRVEALDE
jgi:Arc/MetJ family transcription regulator